MKVLMFGSDGFIGRNVSQVLRADGHEVVDTFRDTGDREGLTVDLLDPESVGQALEQTQPEVVINCAGVVQNNETAQANVQFTGNIISQVIARKIQLQRLVIMGSAAEYGEVDPADLPASEDTPLRAVMPYAVSKKEEVALALRHREESGLPIVVARIFNPVGPGMPQRQLVPGMLRQLNEIKTGTRSELELSRLDAERDYIDVRDIAKAIVLLATTKTQPQHAVYNVGSGESTTNGELVQLLVSETGLSEMPPVKETAEKPEPQFASRADVSRLKNEFGWQPTISLKQTIKEIADDSKQH